MCEEIDRRIRNFVWGTTAEERKISLVSWEKICVPKEKGGLGLQMARQLNRAYLTKLAFIFFKEKDRLWVRLIQGKYFSDSNDGLTRRNLRSTSPPWKGIIKERDTMLEGAKSVIRDGRETSFWTDCWIDAGLRLIDFADTTDPEFEINSTVADMVTEEGEWNFSLIEMFLQPEYTDLVAGMPPPRRNSGDDDWIWGCESSGRFTIKSAYNIICNSEELPSRSIWRSIWRWSGPNRIRHFLWLAAKDRLLTNAMRARRGMSQDAGCTFCNAGRSRRHTSTLAGRRVPPEWMTLNSDGSVLGTRGNAAAGGLLRNAQGQCLHAYTINLGVCSITRAEIRGAIEGVRRAWQAGYRRLEAQLDSTAAVAILLNKESIPSHQYALEALEFQDWLQRDKTVKVKHIYREANHATDYLANLGHKMTRRAHDVDISDCNLAYFVLYD
ncbi:Putative ribonuclease H protein At1g65750, partial [Linum perenne]